MKRAILVIASCASHTPAPIEHEPLPPTIEVPPSEAWRSEMPGPGPIDPRRKPPEFTTEVLPNGLTFMFLRVEGTPVAAVRLATIGGAASDPLRAAGLTFLTYGTLRDGAGSLDGIGFERTLEKLGADMSIDVDRDHGSIEMAGLDTAAPGMIRLLADAVIRPRLDPKAIARRRELHAQRLRARAGGPLSVAGDRLPALIFADHPYGHAPHGTIESIGRIGIKDIAAHHAALLRPERSALIVAGDLDRDAIRRQAMHYFGAWKANGAAVSIDVPSARPRSRSDLILIHRDNVSQAFVCVGRAVSGAGASDEVALLAVNQILGGSFNSRLQLVLRETKGWTYGANSALTSLRGAGELIACTQVERRAASEAVRTLLLEVGRLATEPPNDAEIESAVLGLQSSIYRRETVSALAMLGAQTFARGGSLTQLEADLASLSPDAVRRAAAELSPDQLQIVVVANARGLRDEMEKLGLGTVALSE